MNELISRKKELGNLQLKLLAGTSAVALIAQISLADTAKAEDAGHPALWMELGGQLDLLDAPSQSWVPPNLPPVIDHPVEGILEQHPRIGYDADAKLTIQPGITDWAFSASVRYGKARRGPKFAHDQTYQKTPRAGKYVPTTYAFTDLHAVEETKHAILDFSAGKDVGLGLFGAHSSSTLNVGLRIVQFTNRADARMTAQMSVAHKYDFSSGANAKILDASLHKKSSFTGIGPMLDWNGAVPIVGDLDNGLEFDWGANAALLVGRQKASVDTQNKKSGYAGVTSAGYALIPTSITHATNHTVRRRTAIVPNIGAFAAISYRLEGRGKVSFGYRTDFFIHAMDGGIASRRDEDIGFQGPFATISMGLGG